MLFDWILRPFAGRSRRETRRHARYSRRARFEPLEKRLVLSATADVLFLFDESDSTGANGGRDEWLSDFILPLNTTLDEDNDDAVIMVSNWGMNNATWADGDLNGDGVIDAGDYWIWYGQDGLDLDVVS